MSSLERFLKTRDWLDQNGWYLYGPMIVIGLVGYAINALWLAGSMIWLFFAGLIAFKVWEWFA